MGSGTDVSKNASDVVLTDDNFASIVDAVEEGRRVYQNIRKVLFSLLSCNVSEIFIVLLAVIFGWGIPVVAIQLLMINVVADGIPDLCICREPDINAMKRKPVRKNASIFEDGLAIRIFVMASIFTVISLIGFYIGNFVTVSGNTAPSYEVGQTMAYVVIGWSSVVNIFNSRSKTESIFKLGFMSNKLLFFAILFSLGFITVTAAVPFLAKIFYCVPLSINHWLIMIGLSIIPLIVGELQKIYMRARHEY